MAAQQKYITQEEFDTALAAFSGYVDHSINMAKIELRREIVGSERRIIAKINALTAPSDQETDPNDPSAKLVTKADLDAAINGAKAELRAEMQEMKQEVNQRLDRLEVNGKANHQMLQIALEHFRSINEQFTKINKKLGID